MVEMYNDQTRIPHLAHHTRLPLIARTPKFPRGEFFASAWTEPGVEDLWWFLHYLEGSFITFPLVEGRGITLGERLSISPDPLLGPPGKYCC